MILVMHTESDHDESTLITNFLHRLIHNSLATPRPVIRAQGLVLRSSRLLPLLAAALLGSGEEVPAALCQLVPPTVDLGP